MNLQDDNFEGLISLTTQTQYKIWIKRKKKKEKRKKKKEKEKTKQNKTKQNKTKQNK